MDRKTYENLQIRQAKDLRNKKNRNILGWIFKFLLASLFMLISIHFDLANKYPFKGRSYSENEPYFAMVFTFMLSVLIFTWSLLFYQKWKINKKMLAHSLKENLLLNKK